MFQKLFCGSPCSQAYWVSSKKILQARPIPRKNRGRLRILIQPEEDWFKDPLIARSKHATNHYADNHTTYVTIILKCGWGE
jgi:hypothetical protein